MSYKRSAFSKIKFTYNEGKKRRTLRKKMASQLKDEEIWIGDSETWRDANKPAFWCFKNLSGTKSKFYDVKDLDVLRKWLFSRPKKIVYFHNLDFDAASIFDVTLVSQANKIVVGSKLIQFKWGGTIFKDSKALLVNSVSNIGDSLKLPKGETPQKFIDGDSKQGYNKIDIEYCERDVEIVRVALNLIHEEFKELVDDSYANLPLTAASMAYQIYSSKFWPFDYDTIYMEPECFNSALASYYGGRVQRFAEAGKLYKNVYVYDINSLYPSEMIDNKFPNPKKMWKANIPSLELMHDYIREGKCVWGKFKMKTSDGCLFLPNLNSEKRRDYTLKYFEGYLCQPEIEFALENGWIIEEVIELYGAISIKPFDDYVQHFYEKRLNSQLNNDSKEFFYKILLNSLYGKFGQRDICKRIENPERVKSIMQSDNWKDRYDIKYYSVNVWYLEEKNASMISKNTWAGWAAFVTSYARVSLAKAIRDNKNVLYCDTDSIHLSKEPSLVDLKMGNKLGEWKLEATNVPFAQYWEPKVYRFLDSRKNNLKVKHKGVNMSDGDLTKIQFARNLVKYRSALRRNLEMGDFIVVPKRSKRYFKGDKNE